MTDEKNAASQQPQKPPVMLGRAMVGIVLGGLVGYGLYYFIGCPSGTCLITSSPWGSVVYCSILGFVASQILRPGRPAQPPPKQTDNKE